MNFEICKRGFDCIRGRSRFSFDILIDKSRLKGGKTYSKKSQAELAAKRMIEKLSLNNEINQNIKQKCIDYAFDSERLSLENKMLKEVLLQASEKIYGQPDLEAKIQDILDN